MIKFKPNKKYYFTVDGETEQWYLQWLQKQINSETNSKQTVSFVCPKQTPLKFAKNLTLMGKTEITHICDYESNEEAHTARFQKILDEMKYSHKLGKQIRYKLGYSNFSFELWIVLHKIDCNGAFNHRKDYLAPINRAYNENFENLDQYKHEANFKRILTKLTLNNVKDAVIRSKDINRKNEENGLILRQYKGYTYYAENPSLAIWEAIENILHDCRLL